MKLLCVRSSRKRLSFDRLTCLAKQTPSWHTMPRYVSNLQVFEVRLIHFFQFLMPFFNIYIWGRHQFKWMPLWNRGDGIGKQPVYVCLWISRTYFFLLSVFATFTYFVRCLILPAALSSPFLSQMLRGKLFRQSGKILLLTFSNFYESEKLLIPLLNYYFDFLLALAATSLAS